MVEGARPVSAYRPESGAISAPSFVVSATDTERGEQPLTGAMELVALVLQFQQLVSEMNLTQMSQTSTFVTQMLNAQRDEALSQAKQAAEQIEHASKIQKHLGWVSKLLTWIVTIVSLISAVFTGGASLAIAVAMVAVTIADQIVESATGKSPIATAVNAVLSPIVTKLGELIAKCLEWCGTAKDKAENVAHWIAAVTVMVGVIVLTLVSPSAFKALSKRIGPLVSNVAERLSASAARVLPSALRSAGQQTTALCKRLVDTMLQRVCGDADRVAAAALRWERAAIVTQTLTPTVIGASGVVVASANRKAMISQASYSQLNTSSHTLEDVLKDVTELYSESLERATALIESASDILTQERRVSASIARGMFRAA
ncbi:type III secretion system translocon subunit SctE [Pararobbsia alpina]|uniref:type III secretion system translocon subunit SctE n=1 Tax=Pararobbsia alpina TaxID=621374 RepID=UPI0039A609AB